MSLPHISAADVYNIVSMNQAISRMRSAFSALSSGQAVVPQRINMPLAQGDCSLIMPVYMRDSAYYAVKTVSINQRNSVRGLQRLHALITLFDADNGTPLATIDGDSITALRTGAGAGLATSLLAPQDADTLALFGTGVQATTQLAAIAAVRSLKKVLIFATSPEKSDAFIQQAKDQYGCEFLAIDRPDQLREANIICTATSSMTPIFEHINLAPQLHINGIGAYHSGMAEVPALTVRNSTIVVDQREACLSEAGDIILAYNKTSLSDDIIYAELGELINEIQPIPQPGGITFFKSVGNAVQDLVLASYVYEKL